MACTEGRNTVEIANGASMIAVPVAASTVIYDGTLVALNANGYAIPAKKAADLIAVGRAEEFVDNKAGGNGDVTVLVKRGVFKWNNDSVKASEITDAHLMKDCYIVDDCTVTSLETGSSRAGKVVGVYDDGIAVETL
ncbi:hypothetical protein 10S7_2 [uncultured Caudovirales phage]|uniref:Uncharacterized protein n=1 Tax=uncultured Caudovirales phage TaxID=2100421 RepID=A0A2H4JCL7_9CAUD|nr:hypothetical protein 10S7_2 [uncultured Caudovirales phage]